MATITLTDLKTRVMADEDMFKNVVNGRTSPNTALAPYGLELSAADEDRLKTALATIADVAHDFQQDFGGWGRWPGGTSF